MDVRDRLGVKWPQRIQEELEASDVVVAIIGPKWLSAKDQHERRRIDQEDDWVRRELEIALGSDRVVVPVVFDGTEMPRADALPEPIRSLADWQPLHGRTESINNDIQPLLRELVEQGRARLDKDYRRPAEDYRHTRWPYPDPPLPVRPTQLSDQDLKLALEQMLKDWQCVESPLPQDTTKRRVELFRELSFSSFKDVLRFMTEVGQFCDATNHHPRWENVYRTLWINLSTWDIGHRVSPLDLTLAAHIDVTGQVMRASRVVPRRA